MRRYLAALVLLSLAVAAPEAGQYPYGSPAFSTFIQDSYKESRSTGVQAFYAWLEQTYLKTSKAKLNGFEQLSLKEALAQRKKELEAIQDPAKRTRLELETAAWLHRMVKATIPKFSLERGYEFTYTVANGERQCLLQSVLIAGLLQDMGIKAGAYMVWKNDKGQVSNLGHVAAVVKLSDGRDVLVDASEPVPFFKHQGLFTVVNGQYRFVEPHFNPDGTIAKYALTGEEQLVSPAALSPLSNTYLRSQFYYYRGERAPGGFMTPPKTMQGLADSERFLKQAVEYAPENPLATYVLGLVLQREGKNEGAGYIQKGYRLYTQYGFVPDGPKSAFSSLR